MKWTEKVGKWKAMRNFNAFLYIMMVEKPTTNCAKRDYQRTLNFSLCELCGLHGFLEFRVHSRKKVFAKMVATPQR